MPTLQFLPWCRLKKPITAGQLRIIPYKDSTPPSELSSDDLKRVRKILASYLTLEGYPIKEACLVGFDGRPFLADLTDDEREIAYDIIDLVCFSALPKRDYYESIGSYSNSSVFIMYQQRFEDSTEFICVTARRRDGRTSLSRPIEDAKFSEPVQSAGASIEIDEPLLAALIKFRDTSPAGTWSRWQEAITCFNQANSDADAFRYQVEWVLLCGALERLLDVRRSKAEEVASEFQNALQPKTPIWVKDSQARKSKSKDQGSSLRYEWMRQFYELRNDFAHGRTVTHKHSAWTVNEHLVLSAIAFPIVARSLLARNGNYTLTDGDIAQITAFESFADSGLVRQATQQRGGGASIWRELQHEASLERACEQAYEGLKESGYFNEGEEGSESGSGSV